MNEVIASYLVQKGSCKLPNIGRLTRERSFAVNDVASKEIQPPQIHYKLYNEDTELSEGLIEYAAEKKSLNLQAAKQLLLTWCDETAYNLGSNKTVILPLVGTLKKEGEGIVLLPVKKKFSLSSVKAERIIHEADSHKIIVGDKHSTNVAMKEYYNNHEDEQDLRWHKPALILFIAAAVIYLIYITSNGFGVHLNPAEPPSTYISK